jgi:hypothetical protein
MEEYVTYFAQHVLAPTLACRLDILFGAISAEQRAADIERVLQGQGDGSRLNAPQS